MAAETFILFAEDNTDEVELLRHACARAGLTETSYHIVRDGLQAISYLESALGTKAAVRRPTHVFTDVQMPLYDGLRLLWWIRTHPQYQGVRVAILTNQPTDEIKERARRLGCDAFAQKPSKLEDLASFIAEAVGIIPVAAHEGAG